MFGYVYACTCILGFFIDSLIKIGEAGQSNSFLVEVKWTQNYPEEIPEVSMDSFFNYHLYALM